MLRFWLWAQYFRKFFFQALAENFQGKSTKYYFLGIIRLLGRWYMIMIPPSIYVVYKLYKALESSGILAAFQKIVEDTLTMVVNIANDCFPKINNLGAMYECISNATPAIIPMSQ